MNKTHKKADQYNDPSHNYQKYWLGRDYEHQSEVMAFNKLLKGMHFKHAVDIGGGYGRLSVELERFSDKVTLAEPSQQQLDIAKDFLSEHPSIDQKPIIEVANFMHFRNRIKYLVKGSKMPTEPVDIRSKKNQNKDEIAFVNHNPKTVMKQLAHAGLKVDRILSVSNLRSTKLKKALPIEVMLAGEGVLQPTLSKTFFGPSVFFLVSKAN